jgi:DNA-binding transcriptional regulator YiaG
MDQDWTPVILKKSSRSTYAKPQNDEGHRLARLDNDEPIKPKMLCVESMQKLIKFRVEAKLSQSEMDAKCLFPRHTIQQLESKKRAPSSRELQILNSVTRLGLSLS